MANNASANDAIYLWKVDGLPLYKIGYTSMRRDGARIRVVAKRWGFKPQIIRLVKTSIKATLVEKMLKSIGKAADMSGFTGYRTDGKTEFRVMDAAEVEQAILVIDQYTA